MSTPPPEIPGWEPSAGLARKVWQAVSPRGRGNARLIADLMYGAPERKPPGPARRTWQAMWRLRRLKVIAALVPVVFGLGLAGYAIAQLGCSQDCQPVTAGAPPWTGWPGAPVVSAVTPDPSRHLPLAYGGNGGALEVSPDGSLMLTVDDEGNLLAWNLRSGASRALPSLGAGLDLSTTLTHAVSPDLSTVAAVDSTTTIVRQAATGRQLALLKLGDDEVRGIVFSPDSTLMAYYGLDGNVHLLNVATRRSVTLPSPEPSDQALIDSLAFSSDGKTLAAGTGDGKIDLWDIPGGQLRATLADPADASSRQDLAGVAEVWALAFGEDGKVLAAGDANGNVYLWDVARQRLIGALPGAPSAFNGSALRVAFSPDGGLIAVSFEDGTVRVWSAATGRRLADFDGNVGAAGPIAFALGGKALMVLEGFGEATEWDLQASRS